MEFSVGEVVGEIRKGVRQYEAFKEAEKIATMLLEQEKIKEAISIAVSELQEDKKVLEEELAALDAKLDRRVVSINEASTRADRILESAKASAEQIQRQANEHAEAMVAHASGQVATILGKIDSLKAEEAQLVVLIDELRGKKQTLEQELEYQKQRILGL